MAIRTVHLRKVRGKTRRRKSQETGQTAEQVLTLCGEWVSRRETAREDRRMVEKENTCDECCASTDMGSMFGERDDDTQPALKVTGDA